MSKLKYAAAMSVLLLAGCGNQNEELEKFYKQVESANSKEQPIVKAGEKLQKLENEKVKMFNTINKGKIETINKTAKKLMDNVEARKKVIKEENDAIAASEKAFEKAKKLAVDIKDKNQKKEAADIVNKMEDKYTDHAALMKSYNAILDKESEIFTYLQSKQPDGKKVNAQIEKLNERNKVFQKKTTDYTKGSSALEKEKKDVVNILNED